MRAQKGNVFFDIVKPTQRCIDLICPGFKIPSRRNRSRVCLSNVIKTVRGLPRATSSHGDLPRRKRRMIGDDRYLSRSRYRSDNPFPSSVRVIKEKFCGEKENSDLVREGGRPPWIRGKVEFESTHVSNVFVFRIQSGRSPLQALSAYIAGRIGVRHLGARDTWPERGLSRGRRTYIHVCTYIYIYACTYNKYSKGT